MIAVIFAWLFVAVLFMFMLRTILIQRRIRAEARATNDVEAERMMSEFFAAIPDNAQCFCEEEERPMSEGEPDTLVEYDVYEPEETPVPAPRKTRTKKTNKKPVKKTVKKTVKKAVKKTKTAKTKGRK